MRSPQTIGLECPKPGMDVFQSTFFPESPLHADGGDPLPIPLPEGPRNWGQLVSDAKAARVARKANTSFIGSSLGLFRAAARSTCVSMFPRDLMADRWPRRRRTRCA